MKLRFSLFKQGAWFFFVYGFVLLFIAAQYFCYFPTLTGFSSFYISIATISHFEMLAFLLYAVLYVPIVAIFQRKNIAWIWAAIVASLAFFFLYFDSTIYHLYRFHINCFVLEMVFGGGFSDTFQFSVQQYIWVISALLISASIIAALAWAIFRLQQRWSFSKGKWVALILVISLISSHLIHAWADATSYTPITKVSRYYPYFFPITSKKFMQKIGFTVTAEDLETFGSEDQNLNYPKHKLEISKSGQTNIILILIDAWYYKALDSTVMPNISRFATQCDNFTHHYSGSNGTRTGVFSLFYSIPGLYWDDVLASKRGSILVDALLENSYQVKTFASATLTNPPFDRTIFSRIPDLQTDTKGDKPYLRDIQLTDNWITFSNTNNNEDARPFFAMLFYDALHAYQHPKGSQAPFQPEWEYPQYEKLNNNSDPAPMLNLYKNSAMFVDSLVGEVINNLENSGLMDKSWVIITGDHGQEFNDNHKNFWGHNGNYSPAQIQVPLLIHKPEKSHQTYAHWTSHYDIVPTIFTELFGCKNQVSDYSIGKSLYDSTERSWLIVGSKDNFGIVFPNRIINVDYSGRYSVTDNNLNELDEKADARFLNKIMMESKQFYK